MSGMDIEKETSAGGFALLRHGSDFLGSGRIKEGKILNFVPKARRMQLM